MASSSPNFRGEHFFKKEMKPPLDIPLQAFFWDKLPINYLPGWWIQPI